MEVEIAEEKMKGMEHSEQHYFKRSVLFAFPPLRSPCRGVA